MRLSELTYNQRRVLGQLASLPPSWSVILDEEDRQVALSLLRYDWVETRESFRTGVTCGTSSFAATDEGRRVWNKSAYANRPDTR